MTCGAAPVEVPAAAGRARPAPWTAALLLLPLAAPAEIHGVPLLPAASHPAGEGFVRVVNRSDAAGEARVEAIDDDGGRRLAAVLTLPAGGAAQFNSGDLERGNPAKGFDDGVGEGSGDWRLEVESDLDLRVLAYFRGADGFVTGLGGWAGAGAGGAARLPFLNPGRNARQAGGLRVVNPGGRAARVTVRGVDDAGMRSAGAASFTVPAGGARSLGTAELEAGAGISGMLGEGSGKWRLEVGSDQPVLAMALLRSPTGHLSNLTPMGGGDRGCSPKGIHGVPLLPAASHPAGEGFVRVVNRSDAAGEARVEAIDDDGGRRLAAVLTLPAGGAAQFNSGDLERGNPAKGFDDGVGEGSGDWRLEVESDLDLRVLAYFRGADGFVTGLGGWAGAGAGGAARLPFLNPGRNARQAGGLRVVNPGGRAARVTVRGVDDAGMRSAGAASFTVPAGGARSLGTAELEAGAGISGMLGEGSGKWRLEVGSDQPVLAMGLLRSPTGHLSNLTSPEGDDHGDAPSEASCLAVGESAAGRIDPAGDVDLFRVEVDASGHLTARTTGDLDLYGKLLDASGQSLKGDDNSGGGGNFRVIRSVRPGTHYVRVEGLGGAVGAYRLHLEFREGGSGGGGGGGGTTPPPPPATAPDIVVASLSADDASPAAGGQFTLTAKVRNQGDGAAAATTLRFRRSSGATVGASDPQAGSAPVAALAASAEADLSIQLTAPQAPGTYRYAACADSVAGESNAGNNCSAALAVTVAEPPQATAPDLVVASLAADDASPATGGRFTLTAKVRNRGDGAAAATTLRFRRSSGATVGASDPQAGSASVAALAASAEADLSIQLTAPQAAGTYRYAACADSVAGESDTGNNCSAALAVTVAEPPPAPAPDLVVASLSADDASVAPGGMLTLKAKVRNRGDGAAAATTLRFRRSSGATVGASDPQAGTASVAALAAAAEADRSILLTAPQAAGTYRYAACADSVAGESDTGNNCSAALAVTVAELGFPAGSVPADQRWTLGTAIGALTLPAAIGGGTPAYSLTPAVPGLAFDAATRQLSGAPTAVGAHIMTYRARDADGGADRLRFLAVVSDPARQADSIAFPPRYGTVLAFLDDPPLTTQVARGGQGSGAISYHSLDPDVATVDGTTGKVSFAGVGSTRIIAIRAASPTHNPATAAYHLPVDPAKGEVVSRRIEIGTGGQRKSVDTWTTYASGMKEGRAESIGDPSQFGSTCDEAESRSPGSDVIFTTLGFTNMPGRAGKHHTVTCEPTDKPFPDLLPLTAAEVARRLTGADSFAPQYIADHSPYVTTSVVSFDEWDESLDYDSDGYLDRHGTVTWTYLDGYVRSHRVVVKGTHFYEKDYGEQTANPPKRIVMPEGVPAFLRFEGDLGKVTVSIASAEKAGQHYVQVDSKDPNARLIVTKRTGGKINDLNAQYFAQPILVEDADTATYAVHVVKGALNRPVLTAHPKFLVRRDRVGHLIPTLLKNALDENKEIVAKARKTKFTDFYNGLRMKYAPDRKGSSFFSNTVWMAPSQVYADRVAIHEASHGYHSQKMPGGYDNPEVKALYAQVSHDVSKRYGDEENAYWRINHWEFFAEALTTYIYIESGIDFQSFDYAHKLSGGFRPISQVDSTFYREKLKPFFDTHFGN